MAAADQNDARSETDANPHRIGTHLPAASRPILAPSSQSSALSELQKQFPNVNLDLFYRYPLSGGRVGYCVIINEKIFDPSTGQNTRDGTDRDAESLASTFSKLGFSIDRHDNVNSAQLDRILAKCTSCCSISIE